MDELQQWIRAAEAARVTCVNVVEFDRLIQRQKQRLGEVVPTSVVAMSGDVRRHGLEFAKFLSGLSPEERARGNNQSRKEAQEQHKVFHDSFKVGKCSFCDSLLSSFDVATPCRHWLLKPDGFGKQHFELLARQHSWCELENYLRWVANEEAFAQNINDLADEGTGKLVELTIKYKNLTWSFSCGTGDLSGHQSGSQLSKQPHYHFQMFVDGKPFIRYNDFHLPLSEADVGFLEYMRTNPKAKKRVAGGAGMDEVLGDSALEHVMTMGPSGTTEEEVQKAPIKLDSFVIAKPGTTIKGEDIYNLIQAVKAQGVAASSKLRELKDVGVKTIVSPGPGVIQQAPRSGRKKRRRGRR